MNPIKSALNMGVDKCLARQHKQHLLCIVCLVLAMIFFITILANIATASTSKAEQQEMLEMFEMIAQLDQLDKMDFDQAIDQANSCIHNRNFQCARNNLDKAATVAHNSDDHNILQITELALIAEIKLVQLELEEERQYQAQLKRWAEEDRRLEKRERRLEEEAEAEAEEYEREQQEYARQQRWDDDSNPSFNDSIMASMQNAANEISQLNRKLDRDTNAAVRQANAFVAENRRREESAARQKRLEEQREARQQRAYENKQRQRERQRLAKQRKRERERLAEQSLREREQLANQQHADLRRQQQALLQIKTQQSSRAINASSQETPQQNTCYEIVGSWLSSNGEIISGFSDSTFFGHKQNGADIGTRRGNMGTIYSQQNQRNYTRTVNGKSAPWTFNYVIGVVKQDSPCYSQENSDRGQYSDVRSLKSAVNSRYSDESFSGGPSIQQ